MLLTTCPYYLIGPLLVASGGLLSVGDVIVIGVAVQQYYKKNKESQRDETAVKSVQR